MLVKTRMLANEAMLIVRQTAPPPNAHEAVECLKQQIDGLASKTIEDLQRTFGIPTWSAYWLKNGVPEPEPDIFCDEPEQQKERAPEPLTVEPVSLPKEVHPAIAYLRVLFEEDEYIFFQLIHATRKHPLINKKTGLPRINSQTGEPRMQADTELMPLVQVKVAATPEYMALLEAKQAEGWNIFVCMNPFPAGTKTRTESLVSVIRNLYLDVDKTKKNGDRALRLIDEAVASNSIEAPTSILESSDGNYHVDWRVSGFSWDEAKAMLSVLSNKLGGDPSAIDLNRVLRLPGFKNLKKERGGFICRLLQTPTSKEPYSKDLFKFPTVIEERKQIVKSSEAVQKRTDYIYANAEEADFDLGDESERTDGGVSWIVECPWAKGHTDGGDTAMIMVLGDGRPEFNCFHGHCNGLIGPERGWSDIRELWETKVGHSQRFGDARESNILMTDTDGSKYVAGTKPAQSVPSNDPASSRPTIDAQTDYEDAVAKAGEASERYEEELSNIIEYPLDAWEGTPYYDYAVLACGEGATANYIPAAYHLNCLMTTVGAVCGNRILRRGDEESAAQFYTVMLSEEGQGGKNTAVAWSQDCFALTGLVYQGGFRLCKNIGVYHNDFGSARALIELFAEHPSILQEYEEFTTLTEKFGIEGSGESFKNFILNSYDSMKPKWSLIKGMKLPKNLPTAVVNSIIAGAVVELWREKIQGQVFKTLLQRVNLAWSNETRTVAILRKPDFSSVSERLMARIGLLEEYKLIWDYSPEAEAYLINWYQDVENRGRSARKDGSSNDYEAYKRLQVFVHRVVGHMALWLAPPPLKADGTPATPNYVESKSLLVRRTENGGEDKEWTAVAPIEWVKEAIRAAEYLLAIRLRLVPPPGEGLKGRIQNQIKKWAQDLKHVGWPELREHARLDKFDYTEVEKCLFAVEKAGYIDIRTDPQNKQARRKWVVVWTGGKQQSPALAVTRKTPTKKWLKEFWAIRQFR